MYDIFVASDRYCEGRLEPGIAKKVVFLIERVLRNDIRHIAGEKMIQYDNFVFSSVVVGETSAESVYFGSY